MVAHVKVVIRLFLCADERSASCNLSNICFPKAANFYSDKDQSVILWIIPYFAIRLSPGRRVLKLMYVKT